ncbi:MAG: tetratricopeptide repeat protein [Verrucomicrobiota bacterium]
MPEKTLKEVGRDVRELFDKGNSAAERSNWDYALAIYNQALIKEPGFLECRQALRAAQIKKLGDASGFFKKVLGTASSSPALAKAQVLLRTKPVEALAAAEQVLNTDPNSATALKLLADAALVVDLPKTAVFAMEQARRSAPQDRAIAMGLAEAYKAAKEMGKAEGIYGELLRANPRDAEVASLYKDASASKTLNEGGYNKLEGGQGSYRDILKDKEESVLLEQEKKQMKSEEFTLKLIDEKEDKLREDPSNFPLAKEVAELYASIKNYDRAIKYFNMLLAIEGIGDAEMEKKVTEWTMRRFDRNLAQLDPNAPDFAEREAQLKSEKDAFLLEDTKRRAEKYPNDLQIRYELGVLSYNAGKIAEAIQEFQKAQNNAHRRIQSITYLGRCFAKRGMNDLAVKQFQAAIKEKLTFDEEKKELIYELGCVFEKMGKKAEAIEQFKQIYETDIGYRDVAAKVEAFYSGGGA